MATIVVTGDEEVNRALRKLGPRIANKVVVKAMREAMKPMKAGVSATAPVGETGELKGSARVVAGKRSRTRKSILVGFSIETFKGDRWYAQLQEYGSSIMPGKGWMRRTYDTLKAKARADVMHRILLGFEREASR